MANPRETSFSRKGHRKWVGLGRVPAGGRVIFRGELRVGCIPSEPPTIPQCPWQLAKQGEWDAMGSITRFAQVLEYIRPTQRSSQNALKSLPPRELRKRKHGKP